jgi:hypothetical protein
MQQGETDVRKQAPRISNGAMHDQINILEHSNKTKQNKTKQDQYKSAGGVKGTKFSTS